VSTIVDTAKASGKRIEIHEDRFGTRRYWAKVDGSALFQRGRMRVRTFTTPIAARKAALEEAQLQGDQVSARKRIEKGTVYVGGHSLGPAEHDPHTGNIEQGPHITTRHAKSGDIAVLRVDQSPMNAKRWELSLSCGHTLWVTAAKKPTRKTAECPTCARG